MYIFWHGHSCVRLQGQDTEAVVVANPYGADSGLKPSKLAADVVLLGGTGELFGAENQVRSKGEDKLMVINVQGEYEIKGVFVYGVQAIQDAKDALPETTLFSAELDGVTVGILSGLTRSLTENELEELGRIDVLMLPVGSHGVMGTRVAMDVIGQLEPRIVVPIHYAVPEYKGELDPVETFLKEYGIKDPERVDKLKISKKDLPAEETKVVILGLQ